MGGKSMIPAGHGDAMWRKPAGALMAGHGHSMFRKADAFSPGHKDLIFRSPSSAVKGRDFNAVEFLSPIDMSAGMASRSVEVGISQRTTFLGMKISAHLQSQAVNKKFSWFVTNANNDNREEMIKALARYASDNRIKMTLVVAEADRNEFELCKRLYDNDYCTFVSADSLEKMNEFFKHFIERNWGDHEKAVFVVLLRPPVIPSNIIEP